MNLHQQSPDSQRGPSDLRCLPDHKDHGSMRNEPENQKASGIRVLLVSSNDQRKEEFQNIMRQIFTQTIRIQWVETGAEALALFQGAQLYDLILLEANLPDISAQFMVSTIRYFEAPDKKQTILVLDSEATGALKDPYLATAADGILNLLNIDVIQQALQDCNQKLFLQVPRGNQH